MSSMKIFFLILFIFPSISCFGQSYYIGLEGMATRTNIQNRGFLENSKDREGWGVGLAFQYQLNNYSFSTGLIFTQKGFYNEFVATDAMGNPTEPLDGRVTFNYNYLSIPMKGGVRLGNRFAGFINLGIVPSILLHGNVRSHEIDGIIKSTTTNVTSRVSKFDFGVLGEFGLCFKLNESLLVSTAFTYQHSITSITNENYFSEGDIRHYGTAVSLGLAHKLKL